MSYEKLTIVGNLGQEPELRHLEDGTAVTNLSVAVNRKRNGEKTTTWYRVSCWQNTAETSCKYLKKGSKVLVEGNNIRVNQYTTKDGKPAVSLELTEAADLLEHFRMYWDECEKMGNPKEARKQLVAKIIDRVLVYDDSLIAVVLHGSFAVVLGQNQTAPALLADAVADVLYGQGIDTSLDSSRHGSDGLRHRTCYLWASFKVDYRFVVEYWLQQMIGDKPSNDKLQISIPRIILPAFHSHKLKMWRDYE